VFQRTTAINKLIRLNKRTRIIPGGSSAGKTYGILPILIDQCAKRPNLEVSVVSESIPHLRKGALKDFLRIMQDTGRFNRDNYNKSTLTYTFTNGSYMEFFSADQENKVRGPRRNVLYINECDRLDHETYWQLSIRTSETVWLDFNPSHEFWVHTELSNDKDVEWLTLTYLDNEACPQSVIEELQKVKEKAETSKYWKNKWRVYGLGQLGSLDGLIFEEHDAWRLCKEMPKDYKWKVYGLDFGYTNDVSAMVEIAFAQGELWLNELFYTTGMTNKMISDTMDQMNISKRSEVFGDSSEPKSIDEIYGWGWNIKGATKGRDSVKQGIDVMKRYKLNITEQSVNLIKEMRRYSWATDKQGNKMLTPEDKWNHAIDAARYGITMKLGLKQGKPFSFAPTN